MEHDVTNAAVRQSLRLWKLRFHARLKENEEKAVHDKLIHVITALRAELHVEDPNVRKETTQTTQIESQQIRME